MEIICPNCGEKVPAENINIQKMAAVCNACHHVFSFDLPSSAKSKRRKVKQPAKLTLREADTLHMAFWTNFRLEKDENFLSALFISVLFTFMTVVTMGAFLASDAPIVLPIGFGLVSLFIYYLIALRVFNKTHIDMDDEQLVVSRKPLPTPLDRPNVVNLSGVAVIRCEETQASKKEGYDTPRYVVRAEMVDGLQKVIVNDVTDDYAYFITQVLNEHLEDAPDVSHLADNDSFSDDEGDTVYEVATKNDLL